MTEHSNLIGGSSAERRIQCVGSYHAELPYPDTASDYAEEGTACHEAMEHILLTDCPPNEVIGMTFNIGNPIQPEGYTIDDSEDGLFHNKIMPAYEAWEEVLEKFGELDFTVEARCDLSEIIEGAFGTVDVLAQIIGDEKVKIVLDWKFGSQLVSAYGNYQCGFYAAAAQNTKTDQDIMEIMEGAEKIIFIIIQPDNGEPNWNMWETDVQWIDKYIEVAVAAVERAKSDDAPRKPGSHCKWCKAKADCPEQQEAVLDALQVDPVNTTAIERAYWLGKAEELTAWASTLRKVAHEDIERGVSIPGWKHVAKRATRKFVNLTDAALARILGGVLGEDKIYCDPKLKSPTQAENELKSQFKAKGAKRGAWKKVYDEEIAPHVEKISSGTKLAPDSDPAPAITDSAELLAKALEAVKPPKDGPH